MRPRGRDPRPRCLDRWSIPAERGRRRPNRIWPVPAHRWVWGRPRPGGPVPRRRCRSSGTHGRARGGRGS
eukprot:4817198-Lingulodinium_polyedra.AAC.1